MSISPAQPFNYGSNAAAFSTGSTKINSYATSIADNVGPCARGTPVSFIVASQAPGANGVPLTAAVFQFGAGLYLINANGNGNNDLQTFGIINFNANGTLAACEGCFGQNVSPVGVVAGSVATTPYQLIYLGANTIPTLFQNTGSSITYSVSAIKIANI